MAFGQQSGIPASARQVNDLLALLHDAGHTDFRDARGPMGFTQRQAAGKFTRDEADELINSLQGSADAPPPPPPPPRRAPAGKPQTAPALRSATAEDLASELRRRGWVVTEP